MNPLGDLDTQDISTLHCFANAVLADNITELFTQQVQLLSELGVAVILLLGNFKIFSFRKVVPLPTDFINNLSFSQISKNSLNLEFRNFIPFVSYLFPFAVHRHLAQSHFKRMFSDL